MSNHDLVQLSKDLEAARERTSEAEQRKKAAASEEAAIESKFLDALEQAGIDGFRRSDGFLFTAKETIYGKVEDQDLMKDWADENGCMDEYFRLTPNSANINSLVHDCIKTQSPFPPGLSFYGKRYISRTAR